MKRTRKAALGEEIVFEDLRQQCGAKRTYDLTRALVTDSAQLGVRSGALLSTGAANPFAGSSSYTKDWLIKAPPARTSWEFLRAVSCLYTAEPGLRVTARHVCL